MIRITAYLLLPVVLIFTGPSSLLGYYCMVMSYVLATDIMWHIKSRFKKGKLRFLVYIALFVVFFIYADSRIGYVSAFLLLYGGVGDFASWVLYKLNTFICRYRLNVSEVEYEEISEETSFNDTGNIHTENSQPIDTLKVYTPEEFFQMRLTSKTFKGVYVLYNQSKSMFYVGQAKNVLSRVNAHFSGRGNGDVYADYKYGDLFIIRLMPLEGSGYENLNDLEREMISYFHAYGKGYNKTKGNSSHL